MPSLAADIINRSGLTHVELGLLAGVHEATIGQWVRQMRTPSPWQEALLKNFLRADRLAPGKLKEAVLIAKKDGVPRALLAILFVTNGDG